MRKFPTTFRTLLHGAIMVLMPDYIRQANFTTKPRSHLHSLVCGYSFQLCCLGNSLM